MATFRVMVKGEDGMEFCYANRAKASEISEICRAAEKDYPEGYVWYEKEDEISGDSGSSPFNTAFTE